MLNRRERDLVDQLDGVLRHIGSLTPQNPADVAALAKNLPIATGAAKHLSSAIAAWRSGDWDSVEYHIGNADGIVAPPPSCLGTEPALSKVGVEDRMRLISRTLDPAERDRMYADLEREMGTAPKPQQGDTVGSLRATLAQAESDGWAGWVCCEHHTNRPNGLPCDGACCHDCPGPAPSLSTAGGS